MPWLDGVAVAVILAWACAFLWQRWHGRKARAGQCGHCDKADCGE